jgi:hypothetical protein
MARGLPGRTSPPPSEAHEYDCSLIFVSNCHGGVKQPAADIHRPAGPSKILSFVPILRPLQEMEGVMLDAGWRQRRASCPRDPTPALQSIRTIPAERAAINTVRRCARRRPPSAARSLPSPRSTPRHPVRGMSTLVAEGQSVGRSRTLDAESFVVLLTRLRILRGSSRWRAQGWPRSL